ncbi:MAG: hypothetical protein COA70_09800 [Planctomycetota bacterium]|nr:MAG: hypothetical protein COA70_09800 [Planctomycetota bacterium]
MVLRLKPLVATSACLVGELVRFDGGHRRSDPLTQHLNQRCDLLPYCPEVEMGMPVPRETIRIELADDGTPSLLGNRSETDFTPALHLLVATKLEAFATADVAGFVVKARSPSCALGSYPLEPAIDGLFTAAIRNRFPHLPMVDETALASKEQLLDFESEVFIAHFRAQALLDTLPDAPRARLKQALPDCMASRQALLDLLHSLPLDPENRPLLDSLLHRLEPQS